MPSTINAIPDPQIGVLRKSGASDANLAFETNGIDAIVINQNQNANFVSTGAVTIPRGTTAQRPSPAVNGMFRYNTNFANCEVYLNGSWDNVTAVLTPINSVAPVVSGSAIVGSNVSVTNGTWNNSPTSYAYQWLANSTAIANATANVFTITSTQTGANLSCNVTAINASGSNIPTTSNSVGPVVLGYSANFLVIAGGGGGRPSTDSGPGGGGGAGGYRTSTGISGANSTAESQLTLSPGTVYTITVGAGGTSNANGSNSVFSTVTSVGGGRGNSLGGSGGGAVINGTGFAGTANQGQAGGNGSTNHGGYPFADQGAGGGGGSFTVGGNASGGGGGTGVGGVGGDGTASSITGTSVTRAGGGGGGRRNTSGRSAGGSGVGGDGGGATTFVGGNGTVNTGSGGGGGGSSSGYIPGTAAGGSGGSGLVVISVPTANFSNVTTGSPTVTTSGNNTIITFNSSGTYTG